MEKKSPQLMIIKTLSMHNKEKMLKAARGRPISIIFNFFNEDSESQKCQYRSTGDTMDDSRE